jgi:hypothetical protein
MTPGHREGIAMDARLWRICAVFVLVPAAQAGELRACLARLQEISFGNSLTGVALVDAYARSAFDVAARLPTEAEIAERLLALAFHFDYLDRLEKTELFEVELRAVETDLQRTARKQATREARVYERRDLVAHFFVAAALTARVGERAARAVCLAKEMEDARDLSEGTGTGFSFVDVCANEAGIRFASALCDGTVTPDSLASFELLDYLPGILGLDEGIDEKRLREEFGGRTGTRMRSKLDRIRARVNACPAYRTRRSD